MSIINVFHFVNSGENTRPQCLPVLSPLFLKLSNITALKKTPFFFPLFLKRFCLNEIVIISKSKCCSGCFSFVTSYSNFNRLSSLYSGINRVYSTRFFGINFTVGNGQDFKNTCHIDPIICHFLNFFNSTFKDTAYDLSHTFSSLHSSQPRATAAADLPSRLQHEIATAVLGRPPLVDNRS